MFKRNRGRVCVPYGAGREGPDVVVAPGTWEQSTLGGRILGGGEPEPEGAASTHPSLSSSKSLLSCPSLRTTCPVCIKRVISFLSVSSHSSPVPRKVGDSEWSPRRKKVTILAQLSPL